MWIVVGRLSRFRLGIRVDFAALAAGMKCGGSASSEQRVERLERPDLVVILL